jgi:hypothetical protein
MLVKSIKYNLYYTLRPEWGHPHQASPCPRLSPHARARLPSPDAEMPPTTHNFLPPHVAATEMNARLPPHQRRPTQNPRRATLAQIPRVARAASFPGCQDASLFPSCSPPPNPRHAASTEPQPEPIPPSMPDHAPSPPTAPPNPRRAASTEPQPKWKGNRVKPFPKWFWWLNCPTQIIGLTSLL